MFLQFLWFGMVAVSLLWGVLTGKAAQALPALLAGTGRAIALSMELAAGYLFFCGMMNIVNKLRICAWLEKRLRPLFALLLGPIEDEETSKAVTMNVAANLLGLGNAATPYGIKAAARLHSSGHLHALYMLLILNATGLQLLPTTVIALRIAAGSQASNAILLPTLAATAASTVVGVGLGLLCQRRKGAACYD